MDWLTILPPVAAIIVAICTRNVYWALGLAIWLSEALIAHFNPALGALGSIDRTAAVFGSAGNARILMFCLVIGAFVTKKSITDSHSRERAAVLQRRPFPSAFDILVTGRHVQDTTRI